MEIILAESLGFCIGVRRAVEKAEEAARAKKVFSLGPLIHNPQEVSRLAGQGVTMVEDLNQVPEGTVIVRAHGAPPEVYRAAASRGIEVVDATCPFVFSLQRKAMALADAGYQVVIVGDPAHPEVMGVVGWTGGRAQVVTGPEDVERLPLAGRVGVVAQTTQRKDKVEAVVARLKARGCEVAVEETICRATAERQEAARRLAAQVDVMLVVGGTASSNTQKLVTICRDAGARTYHVESASDLDPGWFSQVRRVGVTAGASTPDWVVKEVIRRMEELVQAEGTEEAQAQQEGDPGAGGERQGEAGGEAPPGPQNGQNGQEERPPIEMRTFRPGQVVRGTVVHVDSDQLLVDVGYKSEGIVARSEMALRPGQEPADAFSVGQQVAVVVLGFDGQDGNLRLSQRRAREREAWRELEKAYASGEIIEAPVVEAVKGGLLLDVGVRGFMPASQVERGYVEDLNAYVGQTLRVRVIEFDRHARRVILSRKAVLEEERQRQRQQVWAELEEGQVRRGVVKGITDFGAFVDLGGIDGLLHVSEMGWGRVKHPSDVVSVGDEIQVKVLRLDRENERVSLGLKQVLPDPWVEAEHKYPAGSEVTGKVVRLVPFGAFVELEPGIEGLVHVSQLADRHVADPAEVVQEGETVRARVLRVSAAERRISLSLRTPQAEGERRPRRSRPERPGRERPAANHRAPAEREPAGGVANDNRDRVTIGDLVGDVLNETRERLNGHRA